MVVKTILSVVAIISAAMHASASDESILGAAVSLELNAAKTTDDTCTLTFMVINGHADPIEKLVYETVLFDSSGQVDRLALFDFGALPPARPRVRQFSVPGVRCDALGMVLINGANTCESATLDATACEAGLTVSSRTDIEVQG
ncbi:hypothetical protein [Roseovarius pelagicus]|uniref:Tat pathway signal sequence domain protein n=1 Tax=Roseovarius pelagicus TaxID=2980108 RepID=A0ABY6D8C2_9RHOB|nr:hypothetical protein [Roseovarius pelagicus]UXX82381.1 hypothetical protein N7U68_14930 [Roseovarius pelagicus]